MVLKVVSNKKGGEVDKKFETYAKIGVWYYVIFDPQTAVQNTKLMIYELSAGEYIPRLDESLERIGLKMRLWDGEFEHARAEWLRIYDADDRLLMTGHERAEQECERAEQELQRADSERGRAERLAAQLRALGIEPEE